MTCGWTPDELERIGGAEELEIAVRRADGTLRRWVPIWVVCVGGQVYVRTWHRRVNGWFGHVVASGQTHIRVRGLESEVAVEDVGEGGAALRSGVDGAYRVKYERYGGPTVDRMVTEDAAASTLRLTRRGHLTPEGGR